MFAGMMVGAIGWGTCTSICVFRPNVYRSIHLLGSDLVGRSAAFNGTLFFTSLFGLLASFANSFPTLCLALFFLGSSVGVSNHDSYLPGAREADLRFRRDLCPPTALCFLNICRRTNNI